MRTMLILTAILALASAAAAQEPPVNTDDIQKDFDEFWQDETFQDDLLDGTGTGGGPVMVWLERDLDSVNAALEAAGLLALPDKSLYWGGEAWFSVHTGDRLFVALGGGGYGGGGEAERGEDYSHSSHGAGYFGVKGILPLHRRLFLEGGVALGGGASEATVERTVSSGVIEVMLRGERRFLLLRPHLGLDLRLARWVGVLVAGGYEFTSGDWTLKGEQALLDTLEFKDDAGRFVSVTIRFGI